MGSGVYKNPRSRVAPQLRSSLALSQRRPAHEDLQKIVVTHSCFESCGAIRNIHRCFSSTPKFPSPVSDVVTQRAALVPPLSRLQGEPRPKKSSNCSESTGSVQMKQIKQQKQRTDLPAKLSAPWFHFALQKARLGQLCLPKHVLLCDDLLCKSLAETHFPPSFTALGHSPTRLLGWIDHDHSFLATKVSWQPVYPPTPPTRHPWKLQKSWVPAVLSVCSFTCLRL